jgi:hypothetical protein
VRFTDTAFPASAAARRARRRRQAGRLRTLLTALLLAGCSSPMPPYRPPPPQPPVTDAPRRELPREPSVASPAPPAETSRGLRPPAVVGSWNEYRRQAAERLVAANPGATYVGTVPDVLLAIPVLEVELNADGSVHKVVVLRHPKQARDTTQLAIDAVHRAAPFGSVSRLPRPWKFSETFLFDDARRFKPRTLDN